MNLAFVFPPRIVDGRAVDFHNVWTSSRGTTGSEIVVLCFAKEMARRGHEVCLYIPNPNAADWEGVRLRDTHRLPADSASCDAVCSLVDVDIFRKCSAKPLRLVFQQLSNFTYAQNGFDDFVDLYVNNSEPNRRHFEALYPQTAGKWVVVPNGCYPDEYAPDHKQPGLCLYTSSPDRGLHVALQEWPHIRKAVPSAELRIYYFALSRFLGEWRGREEDPSMMPPNVCELVRRAHYIDHALPILQNHGVSVVGSTSRQKLAADLSKAEVLAYPCDTTSWTETFSCSTLEGCAAGALPVISNADAFGEIYGGSCPMVQSPAIDHAAEWRDLVIRALTDKPWADEWRAKAHELAERHAWPLLAEKLESVIEVGIATKLPRIASAPAKPRIAIDFILSCDAASGRTIDPDDLSAGWVGGGSRTGCIGLAKALAKRGDYDVRLHSTFPYVAEDVAGIKCIPIEHSWDPRDVAFAYYDTRPLSGFGRGALRIASHHTYMPPALWGSGWAFDWMDVNTAPSDHAKRTLQQIYDPMGRWEVLPNGVEDEGVLWQPVRGRVIYHTTADRGLKHLLRIWPNVRKAIPWATLHVVGPVHEQLKGAFDGVGTGCARERHARELIDGIALAEKAGGVTFTGPLPRADVLRELSEAACFAFPADVQGACETFSVSIMESCLVGIPVILSPVDALSEVYGPNSGVTLTPRTREGRPDMVAFEAALIECLSDPNKFAWNSVIEREYARGFSFEAQAARLHEIITGEPAKDEKTNGYHAWPSRRVSDSRDARQDARSRTDADAAGL